MLRIYIHAPHFNCFYLNFVMIAFVLFIRIVFALVIISSPIIGQLSYQLHYFILITM